MSAGAVGLAASALVVANEVSSGDASTLWGTVSGGSQPARPGHAALVRLGLMLAGVVVLVVAAGQAAPWPALVTILLVALWALWALHTFAGLPGSRAKPKTASTAPAGAQLN